LRTCTQVEKKTQDAVGTSGKYMSHYENPLRDVA